MKKSLIFLLIAALLVPCLLFGCKPDTPTEETTPNTTPDVTTPPDPSTSENPDKLTLSKVNVISGDSTIEAYAAAELCVYLAQKGVEIGSDGFTITIENNDTLPVDNFKIEATLSGDDAGMTITGGPGAGVLYGVYRFLEKYAGVRFFTPTLELCTEGDVTIEKGVVLNGNPTFYSRRFNWHGASSSAEWLVKHAIDSGTVKEELGGARLNYGSLFVHTIGRLSGTTYPYPDYSSNPCLTDPAILATVIKNVRAELEKNPAMNIVSVSQTDVEMWCQCPNCSKIEYEEGSYAGVWLRFVNAIAEDLVKDYPDIIVDTLAYKHTQTAPKITKPHPNVCIRLCSIKCCFTHALDDENCEKNKKFHDDLVAWGKICDDIHIWDYTTNFHYYISTFANFGALQKNMQFYAENNVKAMFPQGNSQGKSGEFGELRGYLLAQLMWNPYMSEEEYYTLMDEFLKSYYGEGWEYIRKFIDKTTELAANGGFALDSNEVEGEAVCGQGIYDHPLTVITRQEYLDNEATFDEWWAKAKELAGDRLEYVERSEMQWRLTKLYLHPNAEEAQKLIDDAKAAGVVWKEGMPNVQTGSDLSKSPYYWSYGS